MNSFLDGFLKVFSSCVNSHSSYSMTEKVLIIYREGQLEELKILKELYLNAGNLKQKDYFFNLIKNKLGE